MIKSRTSSHGRRFYTTVDGVMLPSVTTILQIVGKPALVNWAANTERELVIEASANLYEDLPPAKMSRMAYVTTLQDRLGKQRAHQKLLTQAADIGSQVHAKIEWRIRSELGQKVGPEPALLDAALWGYMAFEDWWKREELVPLWMEQTVYSTSGRYAGTADLIARKGLHLILVDFKTGKGIYPEYKMQVAAYQHALKEMEHCLCERVVIVRLPKVQTDPVAQVVEVENLEEHFQAFLHAKALWEWNQHNDEYLKKRDTGTAHKDGIEGSPEGLEPLPVVNTEEAPHVGNDGI